MPRAILVVWMTMLLVITSAAISFAQQNPAAGGQGPGGRGGASPQPLRLVSPAFADGATLPAKYTCAARQDAVSPPLRWINPPGTRDMGTFALIVHDLEPRPQKHVDDILHWMVWNIPSTAEEFPEGISSTTTDLPDGSHQTNGNPGQGGVVGYRPPCPPQNVQVPHHYIFELFALDTRTDLPANASRADLLKMMDGHIVAHASLIAPSSR
jgi:Raf kinase inhibitor-like YbhB/YbcL family protein